MKQLSTCPSAIMLRRLTNDLLCGEDVKALTAHIDNCPTCQWELETAAKIANSEMFAALKRADDPDVVGKLVEEAKAYRDQRSPNVVASRMPKVTNDTVAPAPKLKPATYVSIIAVALCALALWIAAGLWGSRSSDSNNTPTSEPTAELKNFPSVSNAPPLVSNASWIVNSTQDLRRVLKHSRDSRPIEIHTNNPLQLHGIWLRREKTHIRAGDGYRPVLEFEALPNDAALFMTHGELVIEGLSIRSVGPIKPDSDQALIWCHGSFRAKRCQFSLHYPADCLDLMGETLLDNCEITSPYAAIYWEPKDRSSLRIRNCKISSNHAIEFFGSRSAAVEIEASEIHTNSALRMETEHNSPRLTVAANKSYFSVDSLIELETDDSEALGLLNSSLQWKGTSNKFELRQFLDSEDGELAGAPADLAAWKKLPFVSETQSAILQPAN